MPTMLKGRHALVASRNRTWREDVEDMLLDRSCRVTACRERDETLEVLAGGGVDLLVLDGPAARVLLSSLGTSAPPHVLVLDEGGANEVSTAGITTGGKLLMLPAAPFSSVVQGQLRSWFGPTTAAPVPLDEAVLRQLRATFGDALSNVWEVFVDDAPQRAQRISASIAAREFEQARRDAHSLKSSTATFGMAELAADIAAFELACKDGRGPEEAHRMEGLDARIAEAIGLARAVLGF